MLDEARKAGRPKLERHRKRITTTIDRVKLDLLQKHARRNGLSLGQLIDRYVEQQAMIASERHGL